MSASESRVAECQGHATQREDECQDINANKKQWRDDDTRRGGYSGDSGDAVLKTQQQPHRHGDTHKLHLHQDEEEEEEEVAYRMVPPDGGWGWMVALGTFIIALLLPALGPCFGVLFSGYLLGADSSSTTTAWIFNLQCFLWFVSGLLTRPLTQELGWRPVGISGSFMCSVGMMLSALTPSPHFLFFSFSVLTGLGGGLVTCQCFTILPHYFQRLRGFTNAIMMSGICMGQFVGPPVARYLQDSYGFRGATLILGGMMLNSCLGASFFQPYEWHQKKVEVEEEPEEHVAVFPTKAKAPGTPRLPREMVQSCSESSFVGSAVEGECEGSLVARARLLDRLDGWRTSVSSSRRSSRHNSTLSLSSMDVGSLAAMPLDDEQQKADTETQKGHRDALPMRVIMSTLQDLAVLRSVRASILCFAAVMSINGFLNFIMMVPFAMLAEGFSRDTSAWCVSVSAGCNLVARIVVCVLSDFQRFNKRLTYLFGFVLVSSSIFAFTLLNTTESLLVAMAVYGVGVGSCMGIYNIVIIDVVGMERLASVFGASSFCVAIGFICVGPVIGIIRDVTESYAVSMRITAGMLLLALAAWMFMGVAERIDRRREEAKTLKEGP